MATTLSQYIKHAERFGTECVYETAEEHLHPYELVELDGHLERIDRERRTGFKDVPRRKKMPKEQKVRVVGLMHREGVPVSRIATRLNLGERWVERLLTEHRRSLRDAA